MKSTVAKTSLAALLLCAAVAAQAEQYVISHPGTTVTAADVKDVYLGEKQFAGSVKLVPVDNAQAQDQFLSKVLNLDKQKYSTVWTKKAFRDGLTQPATKAGDNDVLDFVKRTPGAVGYVTVNPTGVNIVEKY
jgi:ABC-type phosphate transport system substrate-binding protein